MSQVEVERFLGRIITDADFRARAAGSLESACYHEGIVVSAEEMSLLLNTDFFLLGQASAIIDDSLKRK